MSSGFTCGECGGGFPHPVRWSGDWVCPWCYSRFMKHHNNPKQQHRMSRKEFRKYE